MSSAFPDASTEIDSGDRFAFGKNWSGFVRLIDERRIKEAEKSLVDMLGGSELSGKRFLDAGSGSGLFSLAARRLGANVVSFDFDNNSVASTTQLKERFFAGDESWSVQQGSVLDEVYLRTLGTFDVVYSWGVLHHTGAMWTALANAAKLVAPNGLLFIAIYNDQGRATHHWRAVKRGYNRAPEPLRQVILLAATARLWGPAMLRDLVLLKPFRTWRDYKSLRGMSAWHDLVDWVGGYPFEVATPESIFDFLRLRSFELTRLRTCGGGIGCNEFVFKKN